MAHPSRRQVAKGVAWTAPAMTIAAAAPGLSASDEATVVVAQSWAAKCAGSSQEPEFPSTVTGSPSRSTR